MYFLIKDLSAINHMYQFSLASFLTLFKAALGQVRCGGKWENEKDLWGIGKRKQRELCTPQIHPGARPDLQDYLPAPQDSPPGNVSSRIAVLNDALLELVFNYVSRALFNADRLTLGMHMAYNMAGGVKPEEWNFFLGE